MIEQEIEILKSRISALDAVVMELSLAVLEQPGIPLSRQRTLERKLGELQYAGLGPHDLPEKP